MITVILSTLVNYVIVVGFVGFFDLSFWGIYTPGIIGAITMIILITLSFTPLSEVIFRTLVGCRKMIRLEEERFKPLFDSVCKSAGREGQKFELRMIDDQFPNAYALGINTVAISRGLLNNGSDEEIKGVLAHELGHHHNKDCIRQRIFFTVSIIGQSILIIYRVIGFILGMIARIPIPIVNIIIAFISAFFNLQVIVFEFCLLLPVSIGAMIGSRKDEYAADKYAVNIGHGKGLKSFLFKLLDHSQPVGLVGMLQRTHPKTGDRIRRLEDIGI